jgi:hypothetical protein
VPSPFGGHFCFDEAMPQAWISWKEIKEHFLVSLFSGLERIRQWLAPIVRGQLGCDAFAFFGIGGRD